MAKRKPAYALEAAPLRSVLGLLNISSPDDYTQLGADVAEYQTPPRHIPYHGFTVEGWARGELLPTPQAEKALKDALEERAEDNQIDISQELEQLSYSLNITREQEQTAPNKTHAPTELSHALLTLKGVMKLSFENIVHKAKASNETRHDENAQLPTSIVNYHHLLQGRKQSPIQRIHTLFFQQLVNEVLNDADHPKHDTVSATFDKKTLLQLHEQSLRERGDIIWQQAMEDNSLGGLLKAIRIRRGESLKAAADLLNTIKGNSNHGAPTVISWENDTAHPIGHKKKSGETMYEPYVKLAKLSDGAPNALARSIEQPWFTTKKENQLKHAFKQMVRDKINWQGIANKQSLDYDNPCDELVGQIKKSELPATANVYEGKLDGKMVNGINKTRARE